MWSFLANARPTLMSADSPWQGRTASCHLHPGHLHDSSAMGTGRKTSTEPVSILEVPLGLHQVPSLG